MKRATNELGNGEWENATSVYAPYALTVPISTVTVSHTADAENADSAKATYGVIDKQNKYENTITATKTQNTN